MKERVDVREWIEFQWPCLIAFLGGVSRVRELAFTTGAFQRARKIESPEDLLRLLLIWSVAERSVVDTAAIAAEAGLADVSDAALVKRFAKCGDWLGMMLGEVLAERRLLIPPNVRVRLVDATTITRDGKKGTDHRLHLAMQLGPNRIDEVEFTNAKQGETLSRFTVRPGEIFVADAAYAIREDLARLARAGAYFTVRFAWSNVPLETRDGAPFDLLTALRSLPEGEPGEFAVQFRSPDQAVTEARLIAIRKSEPAAALARERVLRERSKRGRNVDVRTLEFAGYTFVLSNVPAEISPASVLGIYGFRWQVEMKFKTLKSLLDLGEVPARTDQGLRVYVLAKLLVAVLIESLIDAADSFSPWGYPIAAGERLAHDPAAA